MRLFPSLSGTACPWPRSPSPGRWHGRGSRAIVGARRPGQIDGWLPAATLRLTDTDLDEITAAIEKTGACAAPARA